MENKLEPERIKMESYYFHTAESNICNRNKFFTRECLLINETDIAYESASFDTFDVKSPICFNCN